MPPWGELVERLAWYFNTDGVQMEYCEHSGTNIMQMQDGIDAWFRSEMFEDSSTLADTLYERTWFQPTFAWVETLVEKSQDVILLLGFWYEDPPGVWWRIGGHYVTVAGVNSEEFMIAFSDPFIDAFEMGMAPGRVGDGSIIPHPHGSHDPTVHNDEGNISHDIYMVVTEPVSPGGLWWLPEYAVMFDPLYWTWNFYNQNVPIEFEDLTRPWDEMSYIYTEVEYAIEISPWEYPPDCGDMNCDGVVNVGDLVYLATYLFQNGPPPCKMVKADVNHDGVVNIGDLVYLATYLFQNGPPPKCYDP
ncbi:MAG: dockerin type I repeat-containing protein, partial [candidate division Zixibacteria bacterium]|nr:dockerin type I repeat-containing protein [candidate division Zixibacteria bacterium]